MSHRHRGTPDALQVALDRLPAQQRALILAAHRGGHGYRELARRTGLSETVVKRQLRAGLGHLRTLLHETDLVAEPA